MKAIRQDENKIELVGFGYNENDDDDSDYRMTIVLKNKRPNICVFHRFVDNIDIEYYPKM